MAVKGMPREGVLRRRLQIAFWVTLLAYLGLIGRLLYLQGIMSPVLREEARELRERPILLRAFRGAICDRNGNPLAISRYSGTVSFDPLVIEAEVRKGGRVAQKAEERLAEACRRLASLLRIPESQIVSTVTHARAACQKQRVRPRRYYEIRRDVSLEVAQQIREHRELYPGFGVTDGSRRVYPIGDRAAQVVGFVGSRPEWGSSTGEQVDLLPAGLAFLPEEVGRAGLEAFCEPWLRSKPGYAIVEVDYRRREIPGTLRRMQPAEDGLDVYCTLDSSAQHIATEEARRAFQQFRAKGVSVVVLEPATGDILALVSLPNYDPNPGRRRLESPEVLAERTVCRLYEPGSTLKAITVAAALDAGVVRLNDRFYCSGTLAVGRRAIRCDAHDGGRRGHGMVTPTDIMRRSCNVASAQIGLRMTGRRLYAADTRFGLFSRYGIGIPAEQRGYLSLDPRNREDLYSAGKVARVAFGHAVTTTPLHVANAYAAIANGGVLMQPRLIASLRDPRGNVQREWPSRALRRVLSEQTCREMTAMLRSVVSAGTGRNAAVPGYQVAGKTGTAKKYRAGAYISSFVGYLPASPGATPRAVILVAVDEPQGAYYGGDVAAPVFRAIARRLMDCWNVPEDDPESTQYRAAQRL
ncbi:MAG: penicillin-binding protein 2 [Chloroherpetonaceae bacterium]|nr:penicillin-binding protein 2 [Chthonomonadaceae bacterium]MDW8208436.1 penicillin-binding protein 2 [Chloroherpetonaceae bacterium]